LVAILVLAVAGFLWVGTQAALQSATVAAIRGSGGKVYYDWEMMRVSQPDRTGLVHIPQELTPTPRIRPPWPESLISLLGPDAFGDIVGVELQPGPVKVERSEHALLPPDPAEERAARQAEADALMARVGGLGQLRWLSIVGMPITDRGLANLGRLPQLETVKLALLDGTTGKGFRPVGGLKQLRRLQVEAFSLSEDDLAVLRNLTASRSCN